MTSSRATTGSPSASARVHPPQARGAAKKGLSRAAKKAGRETKEGLVAALVRPGGAVGSMVEVNCETDFVSRTDEFQGFVEAVIGRLDQSGADDLLEQPLAGDPRRTIRLALNELIGKLGENMQLARAVRFEAPQAGWVHAYVHPGARVGVLIETAADKPGARDSAQFQQLIHAMAMKVAAAQPRSISREHVDAATLEKEGVAAVS